MSRSRLDTKRQPVAIAVSVATGLLLAASPIRAAEVTYDMSPGTWHAAPPIAWVGQHPASLRFDRNEGLPNGIMTVDAGVAVSDIARFGNGTIEFDEKPLGYDDAGIIFHRDGNADGEFVYLRGNPDCPAAIDCIQYAPITHGMMGWDIYANDQSWAPIAAAGWNHLRITVAGGRMLVYVNRSPESSLAIPKLQGLTTAGSIAFKGPAEYANLVIGDQSSPALGLLTPPVPDPTAITSWQAAAPVRFPYGQAVQATEMPAAAAWHPIAAEPDGLVNIGRAFGETAGLSPELAWLKTSLDEPAAARRVLHLGWALQVAVFLNGRRIFSGENPYFPADRRLSPGGRLEPDNASIPLDLRKGRNDLVLAVGDAWLNHQGAMVATYYGWAAQAHLADAE